jgi:hypothetical protein
MTRENGSELRVAIVFAEDAGESLARLASFGHVWVAQSPLNERAAQAFWQSPDQPFGVTLFNEADSEAPALERLGIVEIVEEHRWDYSDTHEYPILEVVGLPLDAAAADYLRAFGFSRFEKRSNGFVAHRPARQL